MRGLRATGTFTLSKDHSMSSILFDTDYKTLIGDLDSVYSLTLWLVPVSNSLVA